MRAKEDGMRVDEYKPGLRVWYEPSLRETIAAELRRAAAEGRSKTERFRIALAAVAACLVLQ